MFFFFFQFRLCFNSLRSSEISRKQGEGGTGRRSREDKLITKLDFSRSSIKFFMAENMAGSMAVSQSEKHAKH